MTEVGKVLIIAGIVIVLLGIFLTMFNKIPFIGKLPGDFLIQKEGFTFYFPLATSILLSIILTVLLKIFNR
jgi:hypothetical protein